MQYQRGRQMKKLLVFTDLDGCLLDHHSYSWNEARPAITALKEHAYPLILNSSKTATEMISLRQQLQNSHPFMSENGSTVNIPSNYFTTPYLEPHGSTKLSQQLFAKPYKDIIDVLHKLRRENGFKFSGFFDMNDAELASLCNLSQEQANDAKKREASEPIIWQDSESALKQFKTRLVKHGLIIIKGGRFFHIMSDVNKGKSLLWLKEKYQNEEPHTHWITIGLGDSYNDMAMLEAVDYPVLIPNPSIEQPDFSDLNTLMNPRLPGPAGWNEAILSLLNKIL